MHRHWAVTLQEMFTFNINTISIHFQSSKRVIQVRLWFYNLYDYRFMCNYRGKRLLTLGFLLRPVKAFKNTATCFLDNLTLTDILTTLTPGQMYSA